MVLRRGPSSLATLAALGLCLGFSGCAKSGEEQARSDAVAAAGTSAGSVVLRVGSWRGEDAEQMERIFAAFTRTHPGIELRFAPTLNTEYNEALWAELEAGMGPDLMYLRSYSTARKLWDQGWLVDLAGLPSVLSNFSADYRAPWATEDGHVYGAPFIAVSHGIYYNKTLFAKLGLVAPKTWEDLLATAGRLKAAGYLPFANASGDSWTLGELVFMNLAPSFIGGRAGRIAYLDGSRRLDDAAMVQAFAACAALAPYLPPHQANLKYLDSENLFIEGQAAMYFGGSWEISVFEARKPDFTWSVFAVPAPAGKASVVTFQLDAAMGINAASAHIREAKVFVDWVASKDFAKLLGDEIPGFFPMLADPPALSNAHAAEFLELNRGRGTDVRFPWERLMEGEPSAYDLIVAGVYGVINEGLAPAEAAARLSRGVASWYLPGARR